MTTIVGPNFQLGPNRASFFDVRGEKLDEETWSLCDDRGERSSHIYPAPFSPTIRGCIAKDSLNGVAGKIARIYLHQRAAVCCALEGILTIDHVSAVRVVHDYSILIPAYVFEGLKVDLVVAKGLAYDVMTADAEGMPL